MSASYEDMDEAVLLKALLGGDESAFAWLVQQYHNSLVRLALLYVQDMQLAEEVAQETWIAVLKGLKQFESRSSIRTWIFTILTNRAKTRALREKRTLAFSELEDILEDEPTVDPERFRSSDSATSPDHWLATPLSWSNIPEESFLSQEVFQLIQNAILSLPDHQQAVIILRDIDGFSSAEVCNVLGISETNQRVLLHRSRAKVRAALEEYLHSEN